MSDLSEFIKKYGKPYNPDTDDYNVPPFQENIDNASKSSAIYNMHMYWAKQDPYVVRWTFKIVEEKKLIKQSLFRVALLF